jgi:hypothetical protein
LEKWPVKGAPWSYKITSQIYTSLASSLKQNRNLLIKCFLNLQDLLTSIEKKQLNQKQFNIAKKLNFALKTMAKLIIGHTQIYIINETLQAELNFIRQALQDDLRTVFEVLIGFIIPRTSTASLFGDRFLHACGRYFTALQVWWYLTFPLMIVQRTLLHLKNNKNKTFIFINYLE